MSRQRQIGRIFCIFLCINIIWSNCVFAAGFDYKLAAQTKIGDIILGAQLMYTGDKALETALENGIDSINTLYGKTVRLGNNIMLLVFPDINDPSQKAYYIFTHAGVYFRYTTSDSVKDIFQDVLEKYAERLEGTESVNIKDEKFFREKYKWEGKNLDFINKVLEEIYGVKEIKTKGEHVGPSYLADKLSDYNVSPVNGLEYEELIKDAISSLQNIYPDISKILQDLLDKNKIKIAGAKDREDNYFIYLNMFRKMRYNLIASLDDTIHIPKGLIELFLDPDKLRDELEDYLGKELFNILAGGRNDDELKEWLRRCFAGGLTHEAYEVGEWIKNKEEYNRKKAHPSANERERIVAGISPFNGESSFDDITKFLVLKELKMKPDILIFDILRDRLRNSEDVTHYIFGFERHGLRDIELKGVKERLEKLFDETTQEGEKYYLITFKNRVLAFSKTKADDSEIVYSIYPTDRIAQDYEYIVKRSKKPVHERLTLTYEELRECHKEWLKKKELGEESNIDGIFLAGGKGFSLSLMDEVVDVPPGLTISTTAYFSFISSNPELRKLIDEKLKTLDAMDDRARQVAAKEIRDAIINTPVSEEIKEEIKLMYRYLDAKAVAIRSSGIKEDMEISTWLPISTGSQAGQADTYLNVKGEGDVLEKVRADWASLFTDRAIGYRDDSVFLIFSSMIGIEDSERKKNYYELLGMLRTYGHDGIADILTNLKNPGSYNLLKAINDMLMHRPDDPLLIICKKALEDAREDFINPSRLGIAVVMMQMVKSYLSGVGFNVNPSTKYGAKSRALWHAWHENENFVHLDKDGNIVGTKPLLVSFEINYGYGETVVGGMVDPDKYTMGTNDGKNWFVLEKRKGAKHIQMIDIEESFRRLSKRISEDEIRKLSVMLRKAIGYEEVSRFVESILTTYLNIRYLKGSDKIEKIAKEISDAIKEGKAGEDIINLIMARFEVAERKGQYGIDVEIINELVDKLYAEVDKAKKDSEKSREGLENYFKSNKKAGDFIKMAREVWSGQRDKTIEERNEILTSLNQDEASFQNLAYLFRAIIDRRFTTLVFTSVNHQRAFTLTDNELHHVAGMIAKISDSYRDDRDVEFAIEIDPSAPGGKRVNIVNMLEVDGRFSGKMYARLYNVQARPYTAPVVDIDLEIKRTEIDEEFVKNKGLKPIATGTKGENACAGFVYKFDINRDIASQAEEIKRTKSGDLEDEEQDVIRKTGINPSRYMSVGGEKPEQVLPVILLLEEADPSHDPLMRLCDAVITSKGGETSHAAIFCREQGIPDIAGAGKLDVKYGDWLVADANNGKIYGLEIPWIDYYRQEKRFPIKTIRFIFRPYLVPFEEGDPKIGYIMAAEKTAQEVSVTQIAPDAAGISLARAEFKGEEIGINVIAGYGYDLIEKIERDELKEEELTPFQKDIVEKLRKHPWVIEEIRHKLVDEGYSSFSEFVREKFYYFYNNLGFSLAPDQINKSRAYDFAQDKVRGLIGSEVFSWPGINPLVGLRGASLEVKGVQNGEGGYQEILSFILESLIDADQNTLNQGWFYVFIRTTRELKVLCEIIKKVGMKKGKLPKEIGIMIEVPSNAILIGEFAKILLGLKKDCKEMGIPFEKLFFSFGTNDYAHLAGKGDRDDLKMKLDVMDTTARKDIQKIKERGYFYVDKPGYLPLIDEGSDVMLQLIESVVKEAEENGITTSLCGEAITQLLNRKNYVAAGKIMKILDSFGISMVQQRLSVAMRRYDVMRMDERLAETGKELFALDGKEQDTGVVKGELVFVDKPSDLISDELKGLKGKEFENKIRHLKYNAPQRLSRVAGKIVVITRNFGSVEELERMGIPCDHLQYAKAIILDSDVVKDPVFSPRVKGRKAGLYLRRSELEGKQATIDYTTGRVYEGHLKTEKMKSELRTLPIPAEEPDIKSMNAVKEDANLVYKSIGINPLILLAYANGKLGTFKPRFIDVITQLIEEAKKIQAEQDNKKRQWLIKQYEERIKEYYREGKSMEEFLLKVCDGLLIGPEISDFIKKADIEELADKYFEELKKDIEDTLKGRKAALFIKEKFAEHIAKVVQDVCKQYNNVLI